MQPLWQLQRKYRISTKEKKREFKHATTKKKKKNHPSTNGDSNAGNDRQKTTRHI